MDDALYISQNPREVLEAEVGKYWKLKPDSIEPPSIYLGNKVTKVIFENNVEAWSFSSSQYVQNAVMNVAEYLKQISLSLPKRASNPLSFNYRPEIDITPILSPQKAAYFQSLIGILRWIVELGRVYVTCEVSMMGSMMDMPRDGHLK